MPLTLRVPHSIPVSCPSVTTAKSLTLFSQMIYSSFPSVRASGPHLLVSFPLRRLAGNPCRLSLVLLLLGTRDYTAMSHMHPIIHISEPLLKPLVTEDGL